MDRKPTLYPNLEAELARSGIRKSELAKELGITRMSLYSRLVGEIEFSLNEAKIICAYIEKKSGRAQSLKNLFNIN